MIFVVRPPPPPHTHTHTHTHFKSHVGPRRTVPDPRLPASRAMQGLSEDATEDGSDACAKRARLSTRSSTVNLKRRSADSGFGEDEDDGAELVGTDVNEDGDPDHAHDEEASSRIDVGPRAQPSSTACAPQPHGHRHAAPHSLAIASGTGTGTASGGVEALPRALGHARAPHGYMPAAPSAAVCAEADVMPTAPRAPSGKDVVPTVTRAPSAKRRRVATVPSQVRAVEEADSRWVRRLAEANIAATASRSAVAMVRGKGTVSAATGTTYRGARHAAVPSATTAAAQPRGQPARPMTATTADQTVPAPTGTQRDLRGQGAAVAAPARPTNDNARATGHQAMRRASMATAGPVAAPPAAEGLSHADGAGSAGGMLRDRSGHVDTQCAASVCQIGGDHAHVAASSVAVLPRHSLVGQAVSAPSLAHGCRPPARETPPCVVFDDDAVEAPCSPELAMPPMGEMEDVDAVEAAVLAEYAGQ